MRRFKEKKYRFSFSDLLILISVAILCIVCFATANSDSGEPNGEIYYTLTVYGVDESVENAISVSQTVSDENGLCLGTVRQVTVKDSHISVYDEKNAEYVDGYDYGKRDIEIKISSPVRINENSYSIGNASICVGGKYKIHTSDFYAEGVCTSLQTGGEANE